MMIEVERPKAYRVSCLLRTFMLRLRYGRFDNYKGLETVLDMKVRLAHLSPLS